MAGYRGFAEWVADDFVFWRDLGLSIARVDPPVAWHVPQVLPSDIGRPHTAPVIISLTRSSHFRRRGRFGNRRLIRRRLWFAGEALRVRLPLSVRVRRGARALTQAGDNLTNGVRVGAGLQSIIDQQHRSPPAVRSTPPRQPRQPRQTSCFARCQR